jgi:L-lysine 6-transaminase
MVRFDRILEVMEEDQLVEHAGQVGVHLQQRLHELADESPLVGAVRGIGLMCAFDMPSAEVRDRFLKRCYEKGLVILGCGIRTVRFRSPLIITEEEIDLGIEIIRETIREMEHDRVAG